jgi:5-methylcytosine-specific restriction endonuclease McrA
LTTFPGIFRWNSTLRTYCAMTRSPLRRQSKHHRASQRVWSKVTAERIRACGGRCQVNGPTCQLRATEGHHILARSQGGRHDAGNCLPACHACHEYIGTHRSWAVARGFIVESRQLKAG